jgi:hypothetical protein
MRQNKQIVIENQVYDLTNYPATKGYKVLTKLLKIIGGPLGLAADGAKGKSLAELEMGDVVKTLFENLDSPEGHALMMELLESIYINNRPLKNEVDTHFAGRIGAMMELLTEQVKFQFEDVFQKLAKLFQGEALAGILTQSPSTSAGPSGAVSSLKSQRLKK